MRWANGPVDGPVFKKIEVCNLFLDKQLHFSDYFLWAGLSKGRGTGKGPGPNEILFRSVIMKEQNEIPTQVELAINYFTNRLARSFRLQPADRDDVRQELTLKALIIIEDFEEGEASLVTYTKRCLENKASDIARDLRNLPPITNCNDASTAMDIEEQYSYSADRKEDHVPLVVSMGSQLQHVSACNHEHDLPLKMDIEAILPTLTPRQRQIVDLLEDGKNQEQIAEKLLLTQPRITQIIQDIQKKFLILRK